MEERQSNGRKGKKVALATAAVGTLILGIALIAVRDPVSRWVQDSFGARAPLRPKTEGERVDIAPGTIELVEFLRFLSDFTGLPLVFDSGDPRIAKGKIVLAAPMESVDAEVVRALLEANGYRVDVETLAGGKQVLHVTATR